MNKTIDMMQKGCYTKYSSKHLTIMGPKFNRKKGEAIFICEY